MGKPIDLTGQVFGRLTVCDLAEERRGEKRVWRCDCSCGREHLTTANQLRKGACQSCGCLQKEVFARNAQRTGPDGMRCPYSRQRLEQIYKDGTPIYLIAEQAGVGAGVIRRWLKEFQIDRRNQSQVRKLTCRKYRHQALARMRAVQSIAAERMREGRISRDWLRTAAARKNHRDGLLKYHAARRAKQQAEREQSEAIERALNGDTFK